MNTQLLCDGGRSPRPQAPKTCTFEAAGKPVAADEDMVMVANVVTTLHQGRWENHGRGDELSFECWWVLMGQA